ncbi:hypothetical protein STRIP9103_06362 [Streptomyces ipomoeae 91-03]|uniref:Uncharacterized protein n=1 Tax=Streptomyces ipomoeae 91-03 TaxID=698759 RepID=L1KQY7_9ACTN|nr:hypothetical protein STRIP9103_06362 [Streptomyces ipomoeae 91-03]
MGHNGLGKRQHGLHTPPLPGPVLRPGNGPPLQLLPPLRSRSSPIPHDRSPWDWHQLRIRRLTSKIPVSGSTISGSLPHAFREQTPSEPKSMIHHLGWNAELRIQENFRNCRLPCRNAW